MADTKTVLLQRFLRDITEKGYTTGALYTDGKNIKYLKLYTTLQRKTFLLHLPERFRVAESIQTLMIEPIEDDYRSYRQREYLTKIALEHACCVTDLNICIKSGDSYKCYLVEPEIPPVVGDDDDSSDIELDDFPVEDIYPIFQMGDFIKHIDDFEGQILQAYDKIRDIEEEMNEEEIGRLLNAFDKVKERIRERIFDLHQRCYNIRRDIAKYGDNLDRIYKLREKTLNQPDRVRFKIERLASETEGKIDALNEKLRVNRNDADLILKRYAKYLELFNEI